MIRTSRGAGSRRNRPAKRLAVAILLAAALVFMLLLVTWVSELHPGVSRKSAKSKQKGIFCHKW